jgi:glyoxylase-like metal-dependent hydrolase (beta-lactamase superfamily II)
LQYPRHRRSRALPKSGCRVLSRLTGAASRRLEPEGAANLSDQFRFRSEFGNAVHRSASGHGVLMAYLTEPLPAYGRPQQVAAGIRRIVAPNPGIMTYHGTNTYLLDRPAGVAVIDPGPEVDSHVEAVLEAAGAPITEILLTHTHGDHAGAVNALRAASGAPVLMFHRSATDALSADIPLADGDVACGLTALHTPGHAADHLCFASKEGILFSGDHVMSWSSSVVWPPRGDMADYCAALRGLLHRDDRLYLPGHGPPLSAPRRFVADLLRHREAREDEILKLLRSGTGSPEAIARQLYAKRGIHLQPAARANVAAHLLKLEKEGLASQVEEVWHAL